MNVDHILKTLNTEKVDYLLIGGMNFLLRHLPELTFDVDIWIRDTPANLKRLNQALAKLGAMWGPDEKEWAPVPADSKWLAAQSVFCLTSAHGAIDVFREVLGLEGRYDECLQDSLSARTASGVPFASLSDEHMLQCQEALPTDQRNLKRVEVLREAIQRRTKT